MIVENEDTHAKLYIRTAKEELSPMAGHIQCDLSIPWDTDRNDLVSIDHIAATEMRKGWGTKAMKVLCALADRMNITLTLGVANETDGFYYGDEDEDDGPTAEPDEFAPPSESDLIYFYDCFGFEQQWSMSDRVIMTRTPA